MAEGPSASVELSAESRTDVREPVADEPLRTFPYVLGLALQIILWMLVFLGITIAVLVGGKLTEFRYVGF